MFEVVDENRAAFFHSQSGIRRFMSAELFQGSLAFLVSTLISRFPDIVESGGGILRNVSSVVATNNDYRTVSTCSA